jgi:esterase/lipase superfamily enzyme
LDLTRDLGGQYGGSIELTDAGVTHGVSDCIKLIMSDTQQLPTRALIFIHGYANTFEASLGRAISMACDYRFKGPILLWAWPSDGRFGSYPYDEDSTKWTAPHFVEFLAALHRSFPKLHLSIMSHSMGARILLAALQEIKLEKIPVDNIIFAAPDEARDVFAQSMSSVGKIASIQTLYGSENDLALSASRWAHSPDGRPVPRAGDGGKSILILKKTESIDTSELPKSDAYGHAYVFDNKIAVTDVKELLVEHRSAQQRGLQERHLQQKTYWSLLP